MRGCIGVFLFLIFVAPLLFAFEMTAALSTWLFKPEFYTEVLSTPEMYVALLESAIEQGGETGAFLYNSDEYESILASLDTEEWRAAVQSVAQQFFNVIEGRATSVTFRVPLAPLEVILQGGSGEEFIRLYADRLPTCGSGQEPTDMPTNLSGFPLPLCIPRGQTAETYVNGLVERLPSILAGMPQQVEFTLTADGQLLDGIKEFSGSSLWSLTSAIVAAVTAFGVVAVGAWFVTGLISAARLRGRLLWLGAMLVLPSLVVMAIGLGAIAITSVWLLEITDNPTVTGVTQNAASATMGSVLQTIPISFFIAGAIPAGIGALLFIFGLMLPSNRRDAMLRDLSSNPTTQYAMKPKNDFQGYDKPKNDFDVFNKPKNDRPDDDIIRPL